jgi:hypothetical protein
MIRTEQRGPSHRSVELGVAVATMLFAVIVIGGSVGAGIGWGVEGPMAGFFPFYVGLFIMASGIVNFVTAFSGERGGRLFAEWGQLGQVVSVVVPSALYVAFIPLIGIYVASALLIGSFMRWLGHYRWATAAAVALIIPIITFIVFEKWFLVPLPKGPIEELLGF